MLGQEEGMKRFSDVTVIFYVFIGVWDTEACVLIKTQQMHLILGISLCVNFITKERKESSIKLS